MALEADLQSAALAGATVLSLALFAIALLSFRRSRETRILLVSVAFGIFAVKNAVLTVLLVTGTLPSFPLVSAGLDTAILLSFYAALFRRPRG